MYTNSLFWVFRTIRRQILLHCCYFSLMQTLATTGNIVKWKKVNKICTNIEHAILGNFENFHEASLQTASARWPAVHPSMQVLLPDRRVPKTYDNLEVSSQLRPAANINRLISIVATAALLAALQYWYIGRKILHFIACIDVCSS